MSNSKKSFDEIEYFTDVAKIRHTIARYEKEFGLVDEVVVNNQCCKADPIYNRIEPTGAFGLSFLKGYPDAIFTPYGEVKIDSAKHNSTNYIDKAYLLGALKKAFGLVEVETSLEKYGVAKGARYAITKLPWKEKQKLPATYQRQKGVWDISLQIANLRHLDTICKTVNENLMQNGESEYIIPDSVKKTKLNINQANVNHVVKGAQIAIIGSGNEI